MSLFFALTAAASLTSGASARKLLADTVRFHAPACDTAVAAFRHDVPHPRALLGSNMQTPITYPGTIEAFKCEVCTRLKACVR